MSQRTHAVLPKKTGGGDLAPFFSEVQMGLLVLLESQEDSI